MKSKFIMFAAGIAVGLLAMGVVWTLMSPTASESPVAPEEVARLNRQVAALQKEVHDLQNANTDLSNKLAQPPPAPPTRPAAQPRVTGVSTNGFGVVQMRSGTGTNVTFNIGNMIRKSQKQQMELQLAPLKLRLQLTDMQTAQVRQLMEAQSELMARVMEGKATPDERQRLHSQGDPLRSGLQTILTPQQLAEYDQYKLEQRQSQAQMMANMELNSLQQTLQLSTEQQDKVFQILYQEADQRMTTPGQATDVDTKKAAMRQILSPEQFDVYEKYLDTHRHLTATTIMIGEAGIAAGSVIIQQSTTPVEINVTTEP